VDLAQPVGKTLRVTISIPGGLKMARERMGTFRPKHLVRLVTKGRTRESAGRHGIGKKGESKQIERDVNGNLRH